MSQFFRYFLNGTLGYIVKVVVVPGTRFFGNEVFLSYTWVKEVLV